MSKQIEFEGQVVSGRGISTAELSAHGKELSAIIGGFSVSRLAQRRFESTSAPPDTAAFVFDRERRMLWPGWLNGVDVWIYRWRDAPLHIAEILSLVHMRENLTLKDGDDVILRVNYEQIGAINFVSRFAWVALWAGRRHWFYSRDTYYDGTLRSLGVKLGAAQQQPCETATSYLHQVHRHIKWARFGTSGNSRLKRIAKRSVAPIYWQVQPILQAVSEVRSRYRYVKSNYGSAC